MALGAIINANNAGPPRGPRRHAQLPLRLPAAVRGARTSSGSTGNLTLTYATQIHVAIVEVDPETGVYEIVDYAAVDDCGVRIHPQIVEGQVMGATAHGARRGDPRDVHLRRGREPADAQLLRLPRAARARHAAAQDRQHREPLAVHAARHEGHGRGRRRRDPRGLRRAAGRAQRARQAGRLRQLQPVPPGLGAAQRPRVPRGRAWPWRRGEGRGRARVRRAARIRLARAERPGARWRRRCPASRASTSRTTGTGAPR